jgi:Uma2 family endonuclease
MASGVQSLPRLRHWKRAEYDRLTELGFFQPGERLELIDGLLVVRQPHGSRHAAAIRRIVTALRRALGEEWQIDSQLPIALDDDSEPEPDVAVVPADPSAYRDAHPTRAVLVVEVADTPYRIDHEYKASLHARAAIPDFWIVDLSRDTIEIHREPHVSPTAPCGWRYLRIDTLRPPAGVVPLVAPGTAILVADLLP